MGLKDELLEEIQLAYIKLEGTFVLNLQKWKQNLPCESFS